MYEEKFKRKVRIVNKIVNKLRRNKIVVGIILMMILLGVGCSSDTIENKSDVTQELEQSINENDEDVKSTQLAEEDKSSIPKYSGKAYAVINNNIPSFKNAELKTKSYEHYGNLDALGRCTVAKACIGKDIMPREERGSIGRVKPSGWQTVKYDIVDGKYLYNRCHLIGYQLTGENANECNLITGTRYMNVDGMLPFENMVADYVEETGNHVLYKVTPVYKGNNLVATGVKMEAKSVEDKGKGICFNVFVYNVQPGITINYATGVSKLTSGANVVVTNKPTPTNKPLSDNQSTKKPSNNASSKKTTYILNNNTKKYHLPNCKSVARMNKSNRIKYVGSAKELENKGYDACKNCH